MSNEVILNNVSKAYGNNLVLNKLNLCVKDGELVSLLGSSGCGKTTALRIIAGFLTADTGRVMIGDTDCTYMPPNKRNTGMVFQSYALFPHMSVKENVGFGLKIQKTPSTEAALRIKEILMTTRLEEFADRYPRQLSGGQQQRVALARALVVRPRVLLLDEPLSNLDAKLRHEMRVEIRMLHEKYGLTTIFVTHDQEEALTMSDRIMVMNHGEIVQSGSPREVFDNPKTRFVADFTAVRNFFAGHVCEGRFITNEGDSILLPAGCNEVPAVIGIRPVNILFDAGVGDDQRNCISATVKIATFLGKLYEVLLETASGHEVLAEIPVAGAQEEWITKGNRVTIGWKDKDMLLLAE